jgi:DNA polymerase I-like protein with 3'-5' exonuclease and polymerase domains
LKHFEFKNSSTDGQPDSYEIDLLYSGSKSEHRVLYVLDYVPSEDLASKKILSGDSGKLFYSLLRLARDRWVVKESSHDYLVCNWNAYRTVGKSDEFKKEAYDRFSSRLEKIILKYRPTLVVTMGREPSRFLCPHEPQGYLGVVLPTKIQDYKFKTLNTLSLNTLITQPESTWLLGDVARHLANALAGKTQFSVKCEPESFLVDTTKKFEKMMSEIEASKIVAIDTETTNLNKVQNRLLSFQACTATDHGYFLPIHHKDSPFDTSQLSTIKNRLKEYFETTNARWHVYTNAVFDLNVMRSKKNLNVGFFKTDIWDIFSGEFALDENLKVWSTYGNYQYSLANLSRRYGCFAYESSEFKKSDRATIVDRDLDEALIKYGVLDVCIPMAIREQQIKAAERIGHTTYMSCVEQISDTIHTISKMESTGSGVDINYLFSLRLPGSPIKTAIDDIKKKLYESEGVKTAEKIIRKTEGVPAQGLFGRGSSIFDFGKAKHKQVLYFDVLNLTPLEKGTLGGKLNKKFQEAYEDVPEVKLYTNYNKALKLENSFVKSFIKQYSKKPDFQADARIRPSYDYLKVITGRISSNDPSLHQIPSRSELGKAIKRVFVARPGCLYLKVDFRSHEVRGWGNMSGDEKIAGVFNQGDDLITQFKLKPSPELAKKVSLEADVHKINASYFFGIPVASVDKETRQAVKQIIFGLIYGMSIKSLASSLDKTEKYIKDLVGKFFARFPVGASWFDRIESTAKKNLFVTSPLGLRRNLYGYMIPTSSKLSSKLVGAMNRRARNSPVQGMSAQLGMTGARILDKLAFSKGVKLYINNSVHDSLENEVAYKDIFAGISLIEHSLTVGAAKLVERRHGWKMLSVPAVDFDVGPSLSNCDGWDFDLKTLIPILEKSIDFQREVLKYEDLQTVKTKEIMSTIFLGFDKAPKWLKAQVKTLDNDWYQDQPKYIQKALKDYR